MDLRDLLNTPIVQAPMAGGPSTVDLAAAVSGAGGLGFLAGGYRSAVELESDVTALRSRVVAPFGVNLFVPGHVPADDSAVQRYLQAIAPEAAAVGAELGAAEWDDDHWDAKVEVLLDIGVPLVSFTFGCPPAPVVKRFQSVGSVVMVTVTGPEEAILARDLGADALCAEGISAGGHRGSFVDDPGDDGLDTLDLVRAIRRVVDLPVLGAGGAMSGRDLRSIVDAGAAGCQMGTAFLLCPESGTNEVYRRALADPAFSRTAFTRSFSGRRARGLVNRFMLDHANAPSAYPHINNATKALRRAAVSKGDPHRINLWAGEGFAASVEEPVAAVVERLLAG